MTKDRSMSYAKFVNCNNDGESDSSGEKQNQPEDLSSAKETEIAYRPTPSRQSIASQDPAILEARQTAPIQRPTSSRNPQASFSAQNDATNPPNFSIKFKPYALFTYAPSTSQASQFFRPDSATQSIPTISSRADGNSAMEPIYSDATDSDDEPTPMCTVIHNPKSAIPCIHTTSSTKSFHTKRFINRPYRKTMLSLLCRVRTEPTDAFASGKSPVSSTRIQVYACYQPHWNPKFNVPVLTVVACCNTVITHPIMTRTEPSLFSLKFQCVAGKEQGTFTFKMPIFTTMETIDQPLILEQGPHSNLPDMYTTWFVRTMFDATPLTWIKLWHLSPTGCYVLHNQGVFQPHRAYYEAEVHLLGLTGLRKTPYRLLQFPFMYTILQCLDPIDLGNIGYRKYQFCDKPALPTAGVNTTRIPSPILAKPSNVSPCTFQPPDKIMVPQPEIARRFNDYNVDYYPPPYNHAADTAEFPSPKIFQPGNVPFKFPLIKRTTTLGEMLSEARRKDPHHDAITTIMTYFNVKAEDISPRYHDMPITQFLAQKELPPKTSNGVCVHTSKYDGFNTGERYLIHNSWLKLHHHPLIIKADVDKFTYQAAPLTIPR